MINIYDKNCNKLSDFNNNGIGSLKDTIKCEVTEELNGEYTIDFEYPKKCKYSEYIDNDYIIKCNVGESKQLFRIKNVKQDLDKFSATPQHISYDLKDNALDDVFPQDLNGAAFLSWILSKTQYSHNFNSYSNITNKASARYVRKNPIEAIIGDIDNSFVNLLGGELERDNFTIKMLKQRGSDNGYTIKYGKNLTGLDFSKDDSNIITRLRPVGYNGIILPEKYIDSPLINNYPHPYIGEIEYSDIKLKENEDEEGYETLEECYTEMRRRAKAEFSENNIDKPIINIKINFVDLRKTTKYKDYSYLQKVSLGDTITVILDNMNIKVRVIRTVFDSLTDEFVSIELGEFKDNYIKDTQKNIQNTIKKQTEYLSSDILSQAKENATELILKATTGYLIIRENEILIMNTKDTTTATKIWRWNMNGFAYSKKGINGPYETAITMDGAIVADFITAGVINANLIKTGTMSLNRLLGDILTLGGNNNSNGKIEIKNSAGNVMAILDVNGLTLANGAKLFGGNGVLSNFQYVSNGTYKGHDVLGFVADYFNENLGYAYGDVALDVYIPSDFIITSAYLILQHTPIYWEGYDNALDKDYKTWGYARNIHLYKATGNQNYKFSLGYMSNFSLYTNNISVSEIQNAFGTGYTPTNKNTSTYETKISNDIKSSLVNGYQKLIIRTAESIPGNLTEAAQKSGMARAILNVIGYKS